MAAPSPQDLIDVGEAELKIRRPALQVFEGDITEAQLHASAAMGDVVLREAARLFRNTFIDGARGDALTELVDDHLGLRRFEAQAANVLLDLTRASFAAGAGIIPAGHTVATEFDAGGNEIRFRLDAAVAFGATDLSKVGVPATATVTGVISNAAAGTIARNIDPVFDPSIVPSNPANAAGGVEEESDEELRVRARAFFLTLRRGTIAALEFGARQVPSVKVATAIEGALAVVTVFVADADGNSTPTMISNVATELENWRCAGTVLNVAGGVPILQDSDYSLVVNVGTDVSALESLISDAITGRMAKLGAGETLFRSVLQQVILNVDPINIRSVTINNPAADVVPTLPQEIIRAGVISRT